jgi:hypothetical protein
VPEIAVCEAHQHMREKRYRTAREVLEEADAAMPGHSVLKAMLALAHFAQGDALWQAYAEEARRLPPHASATQLLGELDAALTRLKSPTQDAEEPTGLSLVPAELMALGLRC